jgi:hypothetical protein
VIPSTNQETNMSRLFATFACLTLSAAAVAQGADRPAPGNPSPGLSAQVDGHGYVTVTAGPLSSPSGVLLLLGAFDHTMASLGQGLPSILVNSAIVAWTFDAGAEISVSAQWPPFPVMLQAVEASFAPFGVRVSPVLPIGGALIDADMPPALPATN